MKRNSIILISIFIASSFVSCKSLVKFQQRSLYDVDNTVVVENVNGFKAVDVFKDDIDNSIWISPCVEMKAERSNVYSGTGAIKLGWNKPANNCEWLGIGFAWNNWMAKDMLDLADVAAIQMQVKAVKGHFKNLPVAFAFEDYAGTQTYYGFRTELASGEFNDSTWTSVTIPLSKFPLASDDIDLEKIKWFVIQLEADGDIYPDHIKIIKL